MQDKPISARGQARRTDAEGVELGSAATSGFDPGQYASQPMEALKAKRLKEIRLELQDIPSAYKQETMNSRVSLAQP